MLNWLLSNFINIVFKFLDWFLGLLLAVLPDLPPIPEELDQSFSAFLDVLRSGIRLFTFFVPADCVRVAIPVLIFIFLAEPLYYFVTWLIRRVTLH